MFESKPIKIYLIFFPLITFKYYALVFLNNYFISHQVLLYIKILCILRKACELDFQSLIFLVPAQPLVSGSVCIYVGIPIHIHPPKHKTIQWKIGAGQTGHGQRRKSFGNLQFIYFLNHCTIRTWNLIRLKTLNSLSLTFFKVWSNWNWSYSGIQFEKSAI